MTCSRENEGIVLSTVTAEPEYMGLGMNHTEPSGTLNGHYTDSTEGQRRKVQGLCTGKEGASGRT